MCKIKRKNNLEKQLHKKCKYEWDSLTCRHKIALNELTYHGNQTADISWKSNSLLFLSYIYHSIMFVIGNGHSDPSLNLG